MPTLLQYSDTNINTTALFRYDYRYYSSIQIQIGPEDANATIALFRYKYKYCSEKMRWTKEANAKAVFK